MSLINECAAWIVDKFQGKNRQSLWVRIAKPTLGEILAMFNPLAMPLLCYTRIIEVLAEDATTEFPAGYYFINDTFIQYYIEFAEANYLDAQIVENNILLLDHSTSLALNTTNGEVRAGITDVFLELH